MASAFACPKGWSDDAEALASGEAFNLDGAFRLPKPYNALLVHDEDTFFIKCGFSDTAQETLRSDSPGLCYVIWNMVSDYVMLVKSPTEPELLWKSLSNYGEGSSLKRIGKGLQLVRLQPGSPQTEWGADAPWLQADEQSQTTADAP